MTIAAGGRRHIQITSILFAVAIITVLFRFVSHRRARTSPRADDWTLLAAVAFVFAVYVEGLVCMLFPGSPLQPSVCSVVGYNLSFGLTCVALFFLPHQGSYTAALGNI